MHTEQSLTFILTCHTIVKLVYAGLAVLITLKTHEILVPNGYSIPIVALLFTISIHEEGVSGTVHITGATVERTGGATLAWKFTEFTL